MKINRNTFCKNAYLFILLLSLIMNCYAVFLYISGMLYKSLTADISAILGVIMLWGCTFILHYFVLFPIFIRNYTSVYIRENRIMSHFLWCEVFSADLMDIETIVTDYVPRGFNGKLTIGFSKLPIQNISRVKFWRNYSTLIHFYKNCNLPKVSPSEMLILRLAPKEFEEVLSFCPKEKIVDLYQSFKERYMRDERNNNIKK